jgi:hypothetical protein
VTDPDLSLGSPGRFDVEPAAEANLTAIARRWIENALGLLLGLSTAFQQSGGHHDHQLGERPTVGLATPDGPDPGRR